MLKVSPFPRWPLRGHLLALTLVSLLPLLALGAALILHLVGERRSAVEMDLRQTTHALTLALDQELKTTISTLETLSLSPSFQQHDLAKIYNEMAALQQLHKYWDSIVLMDEHGQQLLNLYREPGSPLPFVGDYDFIHQVIDTQHPAVSDLIIGNVIKKDLVVITVPVIQNHSLVYLLAATIRPRGWSALLEQQHPPPESAISIFDGNGRVLARMRDADDFVGRTAPDWYLAAVAKATAGMAHGPSLNGVEILAAFEHSSIANWSLGIGITQEILDRPLKDTLWWAATLTVPLLLLSVVLALLAGHRIAATVGKLETVSRNLISGSPIPAPPPLPVVEIEHLWETLSTASNQLLTATTDREYHLATYGRLEREARAAAEHANMAKSRFLAAASHDLRQPLQALRLFVDFLRAEPPDAHRRRALAKADEALTEAEELLHSLLDLSLLDSGIVPLKIETVDLASLMQTLYAEIKPLAATKGLDFRMVASSATTRSDRAELVRMLRNILHNAVRYTPSGRILLGCRRTASTIRIEVWDTGIGISEEHLSKVFDEFYQVGNPSRDRSQGLGLGLAVVRRSAERLGHRVEVWSEIGKGSRFTITVPRLLHVTSPEVAP